MVEADAWPSDFLGFQGKRTTEVDKHTKHEGNGMGKRKPQNDDVTYGNYGMGKSYLWPLLSEEDHQRVIEELGEEGGNESH